MPFHSIDFRQCDIGELDSTNKYDFIMFSHSFEHMPDPKRILAKVKDLLSFNGICLIRIPICECEVWEKYQEDWYQIDAPRHYYLYTERALKNLCAEVGLEIFKVVYDSGVKQFVISEYYRKTKLSLKEIEEKIIERDLKQFRRRVRKLNKLKKGDQAAFYIRHKK